MSYQIPDRWGKLTLGQLTEATRPICYGVLKPGRFEKNGVPLIRITDISNNEFDDSDLYYITNDLDQEFSRSKLNGGEILLSIQGTIGRVVICPDEYCGANISRTIAVIEPDSRIDKNFLYWFLRYYGERNLFDAFGATRASLNISTIRELNVPLPHLTEQKRIAAILDKADAIRRKRQQAIQLADEFLRAVFLDMFGDPVTNPKGWPLVPVHELGNVITGSTPPSSKDGMFGADIPFVTPGDLDSNLKQVVRWLSMEGVKHSRTCRQGSLMACCIGATIGKVAIANRISAFNQQINVIEWNKAVNDIYGYFLFKLNPAFITEKAIKTTLPILKKSLFEEIVLPVPSIELQNAFSERVLSTWEIQNKNTAALSYPLFESLSQLAFSGRL